MITQLQKAATAVSWVWKVGTVVVLATAAVVTGQYQLNANAQNSQKNSDSIIILQGATSANSNRITKTESSIEDVEDDIAEIKDHSQSMSRDLSAVRQEMGTIDGKLDVIIRGLNQ